MNKGMRVAPLIAYFLAALAPVQRPDKPIPWDTLSLTSIDSEAVEGSALVGKVVLVVNVASKCGFTSQYEGLQALYEQYSAQGLEILGVPCNQFGWQEPGQNGDISQFCRLNYGVDFTMLEKQHVNGTHRSDLYAGLVSSKMGRGRGIRWNFEKFLVGRDGRVMQRFGSTTRPRHLTLIAALEEALATSSPERAA